ncbi:MAG: hypothetical protein IJQ02_01640 [Oscillospiraceae bacterium]|nr:hypothetical protein [Oscillospiraceae bacterium]
MIYYIADMHFGHENVLKFDNRPFESVEQMTETVVSRWNERVTEEDTVYVLGDAFWKNEAQSMAIFRRLNGHKQLICGNHDRIKGNLGVVGEHLPLRRDHRRWEDGHPLPLPNPVLQRPAPRHRDALRSRPQFTGI